MTRAEFIAHYPFGLDGFQIEALDAIDAGHSVVVAAPTGSGKTVVGEYAVAKALGAGEKAFYTTPLKALSNQKYNDLIAIYGPEKVGLLTGDNSVNGEAAVVVMTTEVLRNMLYSQSPTLERLRYVILDEVHYLQDRERGPVWEEVIIHTPPDVDMVCLSATVSNVEDFADWVSTVRGSTKAVIEERRPVVLNHHYLVGHRHTDELRLVDTFVADRHNPEGNRFDSTQAQSSRLGGRSRYRTPRRDEVIGALEERSMLPAITFIFSRAGCDQAVRQCLTSGLRLTSDHERTAIRALVEARIGALSDSDLAALGFGEWMLGMENGLAAHHAGMVPPFKEAVEACFSAGLVKAVFATETLALGINMPARSVVIENLSKFGGERHELLTPGQYTQLTGRAGRRGIDSLGHAVVLWSPFVSFETVASLASARTYALTSSFRPTYNMAANLVRQYSSTQAHHLLNLSFAQYHADRDVVRLEAQIDRNRKLIETARREATCDRGDIEEYRRLRRMLDTAGGPRRTTDGRGDARRPGPERPSERDRPGPERDRLEVTSALSRLRPGDVVSVGGGKSAGEVVVVTTGHRRGDDVRIGALRADRRWLNLTAQDFAFPPQVLAHVEVPEPYVPRSHTFQKKLLAAVRSNPQEGGVGPGQPGDPELEFEGDEGPGPSDRVGGCPDLARHMQAATRVEKLESEVARLRRRIDSRTDPLSRQLDRVMAVLEQWGYVEGWSVTEAGASLAATYAECDLLLVEALRRGLFDGLGAPEVAALASGFTYEGRRGPPRRASRSGGQSSSRARGRRDTPAPGPAEPWFPSAEFRKRWNELERLAAAINEAESEADLRLTRMPDPGFVTPALRWASGEDLADVMGEIEMTGGDFVRNIRQLLDLLRTMAQTAVVPATAETAGQAAERLLHGVVAASSLAFDPASTTHR